MSDCFFRGSPSVSESGIHLFFPNWLLSLTLSGVVTKPDEVRASPLVTKPGEAGATSLVTTLLPTAN